MNPLERFREKKEEANEEKQALEDEAMQQALESTDRIPISKEDFWQGNIKTTPPSIEIDKDYIQETLEINNEIKKFTPEQVRAALFRKANELDSLYTQEVALSNIAPKEKEYVRTAFQFARESLALFEYAPVEVQIWWFYQFAFLAYSKVIIPRGIGGFTVKEMGTSRGYNQTDINKRSKQSSDGGGVLGGVQDFLGNMFSGGGGGVL